MRIERSFSPVKIIISSPEEVLILKDALFWYIEKHTGTFNQPFISDKKKEALRVVQYLYKELERN